MALREGDDEGRIGFVARDDSQARALAEAGAARGNDPFRDAVDHAAAAFARTAPAQENRP